MEDPLIKPATYSITLRTSDKGCEVYEGLTSFLADDNKDPCIYYARLSAWTLGTPDIQLHAGSSYKDTLAVSFVKFRKSSTDVVLGLGDPSRDGSGSVVYETLQEKSSELPTTCTFPPTKVMPKIGSVAPTSGRVRPALHTR